MPISFDIEQPLARDQRSTVDLKTFAQALRGSRVADFERIVTGIATGFEKIQDTFNFLEKSLRGTKRGFFPQIVVTDSSGMVIGWIGSNPPYSGAWFKELYVGASGPDTAPLYADVNGSVIIGKNGSVSIRDLNDTEKGYLGVKTETAKNVTGAANNGSGLIRMTVTAHGYVTGDTVFQANVGGVPNANGYWVITRITADTYDLIGSTFAGTYTSGGTAQRYYAGLWTETIGVGGTGFADAKIRAFANGDIQINNALITLTAAGVGEIVLDPSTATLTVRSLASSERFRVAGGQLHVETFPGGLNPQVLVTNQGVSVINGSGFTAVGIIGGGGDGLIDIRNAAGTLQISLDGNTGTADAKLLKINGTTVINASRVALNLAGITSSGTITFTSLTASRPLKTDGSSNLTATQIDLASTNDITGTLALGNGGLSATTAAGGRATLDVYSTGEVDTLLAGKANVSHSHSGTTSTDSGHSHSVTVT